MTHRQLFSYIGKTLVVVAVVAAVLLGAGYVGYAIGESNGSVEGYLDALDKFNGLTISEICK